MAPHSLSSPFGRRIQHLHLVAALAVDAAVGAGLAAGGGHEGEPELDVQREILELLPRGGPFHQQTVGRHAAVAEVLGARPVEEHDGPRRRLGQERGALPAFPREPGQRVGAFVGVDDAHFVGGDFDGELAVFVTHRGHHGRPGRVVGGVAAQRENAVVAGPRQSALVALQVELAVAQGDHLQAPALSLPSGVPVNSPWNLKSAPASAGVW